MNAKATCTPRTDGQLPFQLQGIDEEPSVGVRTETPRPTVGPKASFEKAMEDYRPTTKDFPERPGAFNGFAWIVATKEITNRRAYVDDALAASLRAVSAREDSDFVDTLACMCTYNGDFTKALEIEEYAIRVVPADDLPEFQRRRDKFRSEVRQDCTGDP